jgi:hypothetical protein
MSYSRLAGVLTFACAIPLAVSSAQSDSVRPLKWSLSLGADPTNFDLRTRDPGVQLRMVGNLTRTWQSPGSRFGRNISLMLGANAPQGQGNCYGCWSHVGKRYAGLTGGSSFDLFRASRFTPYLQSGVGIYYTKLTGNMNGAPWLITVPNPSSHVSVGINGGFGIKARFGDHEFFVEQMLHSFDVNSFGTGVYPLNFGIRF